MTGSVGGLFSFVPYFCPYEAEAPAPAMTDLNFETDIADGCTLTYSA